MAATNLCIEPPLPVVWRVRHAWRAASPMTRGAALGAVLVSLMVSVSTAESSELQIGLMATGVVFVVAAIVDVHERKLPNRLLGMALGVTVAAAVSSGTWVEAFIGTGCAGGAMLIVRLIRGVGMGDVKMAAVIGASAGSVAPIAAPCALAITAVVAAIYGAATRRPTLALGPALWLGWAIGVAFAEPFTRWWS